MQHPRFRKGDLATDFIADEYPDGFHGAPADSELVADLVVLAGMVGAITDARAAEIDGQLGDAIALPSDASCGSLAKSIACGSSLMTAARWPCSTAAS